MTCWQGWKARGSCSMWSPSLPLSWSNTELHKEDKQVWHGTAKSSWCLKELFYNSLLLRKKTWLWRGGFTACFCVICNCYCWTAVRCLSWNWICIWLWHWSYLLNLFYGSSIPNVSQFYSFFAKEAAVASWARHWTSNYVLINRKSLSHLHACKETSK